jgi:hypothetical protein
VIAAAAWKGKVVKFLGMWCNHSGKIYIFFFLLSCLHFFHLHHSYLLVHSPVISAY